MIHKHEPVAEEKMAKRSLRYTICQVLREIYFSTSDPKIKLNCRIATSMAKAMDRKLKENNVTWAVGFFDINKGA